MLVRRLFVDYIAELLGDEVDSEYAGLQCISISFSPRCKLRLEYRVFDLNVWVLLLCLLQAFNKLVEVVVGKFMKFGGRDVGGYSWVLVVLRLFGRRIL